MQTASAFIMFHIPIINGQVLKDRGVKHHDNIILLLCAHNTHVHQTSILMM